MYSRLGLLCAGFLTSLGLSESGFCDSTIFVGRNVYSPSVRKNESSKGYEMWYGGWQHNSDYPYDRIYYRKSSDGLSWTTPITVLRPSEISRAAVHVNDPSVVSLINRKTHIKQYTMFYTVCFSPCKSYYSNQIWSSVSYDGVHWRFHKSLITMNGAAEPSAITNSLNRRRWTVYYSNTSESNGQPRNIYLVDVDGNRNAMSEGRSVFSYKVDSGVIANPEVARIGKVWGLFFNVYHRRPGARQDTADIYVAISPSSRSWSDSTVQSVVLNDPNGKICAAGAPGVLPLNNPRQFVIFFGEAHFSPKGTCDLSSFGSIISSQRSWR